MKKLLAIAFIGGLLMVSCAKKETSEESNTMLTEPEVTTVDTMSKPDSAAAVVAPMATDSTTMTK